MNIENGFQKGFTLLEVMISILVIGIIASIVFVSNIDDSKKLADIAALKTKWSVSEGKYIGQLIGKWPLDEGTGTNVSDASTFLKNGTVSGAVWKTEKDCVSGTCLEFDGTDDYVQANSVPYFSTWSFSLWMKRTNDSGTYERLMSYSNNTAYDKWIQVYTDDSVGSGYVDTTGSGRHIYTADKLELNKWYYLVSTFDGTNIKIYINGELKATSNSFAAYIPRNNGYPLSIGRLCSTTCYYSFKGLIDEPAVYEDAITMAEVRDNYLAGVDSLFAKGIITLDERLAMLEGVDNKVSIRK
jgi:prepilin-type N-terminal cleavage/methylation domain-containing protein